MNTCSKGETGQVSNLDMINNLPEDAIDNILVHLPIKDAVRTSILSKNWRYKWVTIPEIVFDGQCLPRLGSTDKTLVNLTCANIVYQVFLQHRGPIRKFKCSKYLRACSDLDRWLHFLSRQGIKEIILQFFDGDYYQLPSSLFSCQEMYHLRLESCIFNIPPSFEGFHCLKTLYLDNVTFPNVELEILISKSPLLERLTYIDVSHPCRLKINAPNLQYLFIISYLDAFSFENTPVLASAFIYLFPTKNFDIHLETCSLTNVLSCLPNIKKLLVDMHFLKVLGSGDVPDRVPNTFDHLKELSLNIDFQDPRQMLAVFCLFSNSHNLQTLNIKMTLKAFQFQDLKRRIQHCTCHELLESTRSHGLQA
ncbi:F-box/FBD/LRR-repeat protein At1g13570-like isoform X2 [Tasmannia lanceolata]|uniref:F-box/FBD/LRR-repeat protein At1g13570-like isoform X2 n=1 Tax=Tasmannia lanceolata TaxID=3420 RepID=UPI00406371B3